MWNLPAGFGLIENIRLWKTGMNELTQFVFSPAFFYVTFLLLATVLLVRESLFPSGRKRRHRRNIQNGIKVIEKIKTFQIPAAQISYLRKIDCFVFEEIILTSLNKLGYKIQRNKRYTGDGGIDGYVKIHGMPTYIQAKRYHHYIRKTDLEEFAHLCRSHDKCGLFVHTGKTGKKTWEILEKKPHIDIISGSRLLDLVLHKKFEPRWFLPEVAHSEVRRANAQNVMPRIALSRANKNVKKNEFNEFAAKPKNIN